MTEQRRYGGLDGIRAIAVICIVMMHVLSNGDYGLTGFMFTRVIPSMADLVILFMIISGFSMCCGYYEKMMRKEITPVEFYRKRYRKILPFFALLCLIDFVLSPSLAALAEVFANVTLCFGFLPNARISVIGVGWFIGVVCAFYFLFPFFCYLLSGKKRACFSLVVAVAFSFICTRYFFSADRVADNFSARTNIVFCAMFFLAGGLVYLWREPLARFAHRFWYLVLLLIVGGTVGYYCLSVASTYWCLLTGTLILIFAIGVERNGVLQNPLAAFFSKISLEIYLCHMVAYRAIEKIHLTHLFPAAWLNFVFTFLLTVGGAVVFSLGGRWFLSLLEKAMLNIVSKVRKSKTTEEQSTGAKNLKDGNDLTATNVGEEK